jgi:hypothetical protein
MGTRRLALLAQRGSGTVELALGSLVFVTVLMFGIHFAEVGYLSLKVQEAQAFGIWESTGRRAHLFRPGAVNGDGRESYRPLRQVQATAGPRAQDRYSDFDGRSRIRGGGNLTQALTAATPIQVTCREQDELDFSIPTRRRRAADNYSTYGAQLRTVRGFYRGMGGLQCRARSTLQIIRVPQGFHDDGNGGFQVAHVNREFIPVCGVGRPRNGRCDGEFGVLLGDWALEGPTSGAFDELNRDVPLNWRNRDHNRSYRIMVRELWRAGEGSHGRAGSVYAARVGQESGNPNDSPHDEREFYISYRGQEAGSIDGILPRHRWNTSGVYYDDSTDRRSRNRGARSECYLGLRGCR